MAKKRLSLREFQQSVIDRLQAKEQAGEHASTLGVQVGEELWLVDMNDISEVLPLPELTPVPLTQPWFCGIANVRGNLYTIVDLAGYFGHPAGGREGQGRVLLVSQRFAFNAGLLVTRVLGLRNASAWRRDEAEGQVRYEDERGQVWRKLDMVRLLQQPEFLQVGI